MLSVDLNCDMGEGFPHDAALMDYVSSVNIACGYHAGDRDTMKRTVDLAVAGNIAVGAHPSYHDRPNFGRTPIEMPIDQLYDMVSDQISALSDIAVSCGTRLTHVKPHGALYNRSAVDAEIASVIAEAVLHFDKTLVLFGLAGSLSLDEAQDLGLRTASEVFADRTYQDDGTLTPRSQANALILDEESALRQVMQMLQRKIVTTTTGKQREIGADTICIHGDGDRALEFAAAIHKKLTENGIKIKAFNG